MPALKIDIEGDSSDAVRSFDAVTSAARGMGDGVDRASKQADDGASRMDSAADSADNLGSRSSQAAGGLGDLGGAISGMGGPIGALGAGMEAAAPAVMGVTGAADLLNLAMTSNIVTTVRNTVATARQRVVMVASAAATRTMALAQRVLNAAMRANPIGILITALTLAAVGVVLLYRRSETFRRIVQTVFAAAKAYVSVYINIISALVGWFRDKLPPVITRIREIVSNVASAGVRAWQNVTDAVGKIVTKVQDVIAIVRDRLGSVVTATKTTVVNAFDAMTKPVTDLIGYVKDLLSWLGKVKIPHVPGFGRAAVLPPSGGGFSDPGYGGSTSVVIQLPLLSALDDRAIGQLLAALTEYYRRRGQAIQIVSAS